MLGLSILLFTILLIFQGPSLLTATTRCVDFQGRIVESGERFIPNDVKTCTECLCLSGSTILCGQPFCSGKFNCTEAGWNAMPMCCRLHCLNRKPARYSDTRSPNRDFHLPYTNVNGFESGSVFGIDDTGYTYNAQQPPNGPDVFYSADDVTNGNNATTGLGGTTVQRAQNLPSPYYPILIGLISCAPVALCIICINAVRKYFTLRNQFPNGTFFPRRRRRARAPDDTAQNHRQPNAYVDPPPSYKDLESQKFKLSETLPRYEDVVEHDRQTEGRIFATTSSAQFHPPERVEFVVTSQIPIRVEPVMIAPVVAPSTSLESTDAETSQQRPQLDHVNIGKEGIDNYGHVP